MLNFFGSSCFSAAISKKTACTSFSPVQTALSFSVFVFLFACFYIAALLVRADFFVSLFYHVTAAFRTFFIDWFCQDMKSHSGLSSQP